jgi:translation initiation factor 2 alpha subunit (eIF-2alpha)
MENFCKLVCTTFTGNNLSLKDQWVENCETQIELTKFLVENQIDLNSFKYPSKDSISEVLTGVYMKDNEKITICIRIVR